MNIRYRWNPLLSDPGLVTRVEKPLDSFDDIASKIGERNAAAMLERVHQLSELAVTGHRILKSSAHEEGVVLARQHDRLLGIQSKSGISRVVIEVSGRRHRCGPFAEVTLVQPSPFGELLRGHRRAVRHRLENSKAVTDVGERNSERRAEVHPYLARQRGRFFSIRRNFIHVSPTLAMRPLAVKVLPDERLGRLRERTPLLSA